MKRLIKLRFKHYLYFILMILSLLGLGSLIMLMKIESSFTVNLVAKSYKPILQVLSKDVYKIKPNQNITVRINNKNYYSTINSIKYDNNNKYYKVSLTYLPLNLVPESVIQTKVIYDSKKLYQTILE